MAERNEWAVAVTLDKITISVEWRRDLGGGLLEVTMAGHSRKRTPPLWVHSFVEDDKRNLGPMVGGALDAISYYSPTNPEGLRRALAGHSDQRAEDPTLPM